MSYWEDLLPTITCAFGCLSLLCGVGKVIYYFIQEEVQSGTGWTVYQSLRSIQVNAACFKARQQVHNVALAEFRGEWSSDGLSPAILGVAPQDLERVHFGLDALDRSYGDQLAKFVGLLPSAAHVDLRFLLFRLEAGGKGRATEDGARSRGTEDGGHSE